MKNTIFTQILDETVIELDNSREDVIDKLMQQNGRCRNKTVGQDEEIWFECFKNGKFYVSDRYSYRDDNRRLSCYVKGRVVSENGKTLVKIYSVYDKTNLPFIIIMIAIYLIFAIGYFASKITANIPIEKSDILTALLLAAGILLIIFRTANGEKHKNYNLDVMKTEAFRRVEAVRLWDK